MPRICRVLTSRHAEGQLPGRFYGVGKQKRTTAKHKFRLLDASNDGQGFTRSDLRPQRCLPDVSLCAANGKVWRGRPSSSLARRQETGKEN